MSAPNAKARLQALLTERLAPDHLEIIDDSAKHAGHAGHRPGGETHFKLRIVSEKFTDLNRIDRHRLVYALLKTEFASGLHALQLDLKTPSENK